MAKNPLMGEVPGIPNMPGMGNMTSMMQMMQMMNNPQAALKTMMQGNPDFAKAMGMLSGKSPKDIQSIVKRLYADAGMDINQVASKVGLKI